MGLAQIIILHCRSIAYTSALSCLTVLLLDLNSSQTMCKLEILNHAYYNQTICSNSQYPIRYNAGVAAHGLYMCCIALSRRQANQRVYVALSHSLHVTGIDLEKKIKALRGPDEKQPDLEEGAIKAHAPEEDLYYKVCRGCHMPGLLISHS